MAGPEPIPNSLVPGAQIWGWMTEPELEWLGEQAEQMESIVEVGSLRGRSAFMLLTRCLGSVYCIDPWDDPGMHSYQGFFEACGGFANLRAIRGLSPAAVAAVPHDIDMVFLDGDHDYLAVCEDIAAWWPKTRKLLCGHDYNNVIFTGVKLAVHEIFGDRVELVPLPDAEPGDSSLWFVRR